MHDDDCDHDITNTAAIAALFAALQPVAPPTQIEAALLARVRPRNATLVTVRADQGEWRQVAPGVRLKVLSVDAAARTRSFLIEMQPGAAMPAHDHIINEECLVLSGEAVLGDVVVRAGDYHLAPSGIPHGVVHTAVGVLMFVRGDLPQASDSNGAARTD